MGLRKLKRRAIIKFRKEEEKRFGKQIIRHSKYAAPDFMIIGVVKRGTTSLYQYLLQHLEIEGPKMKEVNYFSGRNSIKGLKWYLKNFPVEEKEKLTFEATPYYLYKKQTPKRFNTLFPGIKLIAILRDPVERAYSHWRFYREERMKAKENTTPGRLKKPYHILRIEWRC